MKIESARRAGHVPESITFRYIYLQRKKSVADKKAKKEE